MDAIKVGNFIKDLRIKNNLTQKAFGDKYKVTYQAVSKWERGINIPDISLLREMSKDFNVSLESILDGEIKEQGTSDLNNKKLIYPYVIGVIGTLFIVILLVLLFTNNNSKDSFTFKTLSANCKEFKVTGAIAYDSKKSSINISNIDYCGGDDNTVYDNISCELYEEENNSKALISKCNKEGHKEKLEDYLKNVEVHVDDYEQKCKSYTHNKIYLEIKAELENKTTIYKIDLDLNNNCEIKEGK